MLMHRFPDLQWLKKQAESRFANRTTWDGKKLDHSGWPSVIIQAKAGETFRDNIPGPLSLFSTISGESHVHVESKRTRIPEECFFLTNAGQRYTLEIESRQPVETFNIHFGERWAEDTFAALTKPVGRLLDQPDETKDSVHFYNKLFRKDDTVKSIQRQLLGAGDDKLKEEELLFDLAAHLLGQHQHINQKLLQLPVQKQTTREEILRRLFLATDYIYSFYYRVISLDELARISCLSRFHFLRLFRQLFHTTPHQFITRLRIERAAHLLKHTSLEVKQVAHELGFDSASSFSRSFYQQTGAYPSQFRKM